MRVLLVEDDTDMAETLKASLSADDHTVDHASDGEMGQEMALNGGYDVNYVPNSGNYSTVTGGSFTIGTGQVTISNIIIK